MKFLFQFKILIFINVCLSLCWPLFAQEQSDKKIKLEEALEIALTQHPDLISLQQKAEAAEHRAKIELGWDDPQVGVRLSKVPFHFSLDGRESVDYFISQDIKFPTKRSTAYQMMMHENLHHLDEAKNKKIEIIYKISTNYYLQYALDEELKELKQIQKIVQNLLLNEEQKMALPQNSSASYLDLKMSQSDLALEEEELSKQKEKSSLEVKQLLSGLNYQFEYPKKVEVLILNLKLLENNIHFLKDQPSIQTAEHELMQKKWIKKAAKLEYFPDFNFRLEYNQRPSPDPQAWTAEISLKFPIFNTKRKEQILEAQALALASEENLKSVTLEQENKFKSLLVDYKITKKTFQIYEKNILPLSKFAFKLQTQTYSLSQSSFSELMNTLKNFHNYKRKYWRSFYELNDLILKIQSLSGQQSFIHSHI